MYPVFTGGASFLRMYHRYTQPLILYNVYIVNIYYITVVNVRRNGSVERDGSRVELRTLDYENPGSNPVLRR